MNTLKLAGCTPEPLMSYLKALGVFRLVAEQVDPAARLSWQGGVACLYTKLTREELQSFFLEQYRPTPILAPWNGGSGFYGGGAAPLIALETATSTRFEVYRQTIAAIRRFVPNVKPKDEDKNKLLVACRSWLSDDVLPWLDVCFVLDEEGQTFFPLLGTGGNDGRLDFTNNFMQRLADVLSLRVGEAPPEDSPALLAASLFSDVVVSLEKSAIGQFNPGGIGGPNGRQGDFEADSRVNPWDYILMLEGAVLFAGSVARRMGTNATAKAIFPFTVQSVAVGYGSATASEETVDGSRAEVWLPLWNTASSLAEGQHLFAEGRAQLNRRQANNAVEFGLAVNLLGVNRGIDSFARYGFLKRNGLAFLAAPLGRVKVQLRPSARLLDDPALREWLDRWRGACRDKDKTPSRYLIALRNIDRALFAFANRSEQGNDPPYFMAVLRALGQAEQTLANGLGFAKENRIRPLANLDPEWLTVVNDGSPEFRLAVALAGLEGTKTLPPIRGYLEQVEVTKLVNWAPGSTSAVWSKKPLAANLGAVFRRRLLENYRAGGVGVPLSSASWASLPDVVAFLNEELDDAKLSDLLWALIGVTQRRPPTTANAPDESTHVPMAFGIPRLVVEARSIVPTRDGAYWHVSQGTPHDCNAQPDADVFQFLSSSRRDAVVDAVTQAAKRLKANGLLVNGYRNRQHSGRSLEVVAPPPTERLLAAMLFPLSNFDLSRIASAVLYPPETRSNDVA